MFGVRLNCANQVEFCTDVVARQSERSTGNVVKVVVLFSERERMPCSEEGEFLVRLDRCRDTNVNQVLSGEVVDQTPVGVAQRERA